ncbi:ankyrin repeat domain-containing protein [Reichenbachiella agarivorans]|uniref:Ankyrin repeat domain-containing protein n=1 Tax=Reichenbachiella agarivorans TaxID=2979464 RepID=A0ABY6CP56_9BACT|nr:ankyrin repeat domain-containing protein [Reichenbachiella agarivorans]UXP32319.1 ankyrin repeat domain-containing protein [Reichenbachiella agarivorans]
MKSLQLKTVQKCFVLSLATILLGTASCHQANQSQEESTKETKIEAPSTTIQEAAFLGNVEAIKGHMAAKTDLNQKDAYGSTPLHIAATFGKTEVAVLLIEGGANLNERSADGSTPLHTAAFFGRTDIVKALLKNKADVTVRNSYNATALESVSAPFADMKPIYDQLSKDLGPFGLKLDYQKLEEARPVIAELIASYSK